MAITIKQLSTRPHQMQLKSALSWGQGHQLDALNHVLVQVELNDGSIGLAEAPPRPTIYGETSESIAAIIAQDCAAIAVGQPLESVADIQALQHKLTLVKNNNTAKGALDMALYGALARSHNTSLSALLNITKAHVRVSFILGTGSLQTVMDEVEWIYGAGVRVLKVKVGKDFGREVAQMQQIREMYGDSLELYVDANQCYQLNEAKTQLKQLHDLGIKWCEEPLPVQYIGKRRMLRGYEIMPLIADDSAFTLPDLERELNFHTFDVLNIKTARNGFSEAQAMLNAARECDKGVMVGSQASSLLGCLHAVLFAAQEGIDYPTEATFFLKTIDDNAHLLPINDGYIDVTQAQAALTTLEDQLLKTVSD